MFENSIKAPPIALAHLKSYNIPTVVVSLILEIQPTFFANFIKVLYRDTSKLLMKVENITNAYVNIVVKVGPQHFH